MSERQPKNLTYGTLIQLRDIKVKVEYQGHTVKEGCHGSKKTTKMHAHLRLKGDHFSLFSACIHVLMQVFFSPFTP